MWFLESVGRTMTGPSDGGRTRGRRHRPGQAQGGHPNVLTPDRIPEFFIPPSLAPGRASPSRPRRQRPTRGEREEREEEEGPAGLIPRCANPGEIVCLSESPHTRRKESLFHGPDLCHPGESSPKAWCREASLSTRPESHAREPSLSRRPEAWSLNTRPKAQNGAESLRPTPDAQSLNAWPEARSWTQSLRPRPKAQSLNTRPKAWSWAQMLRSRPVSQSWAQSLRPGGLPDSDTASSSAESSPFNSPSPARLPHWALTVDGDDSSSSESSPVVPRRAGRDLGGPLRYPATPRRQHPLGLAGEVEEEGCWVTLDTGGRLLLSSEYTAESRLLRVRLVSGRGLYPDSFPAAGVSCCAALCLLPGRTQQQRSTVVRRSRSPVFDQEFVFEGVAVGDLHDKALGLKVINKGSRMRRDCVLGQTQLGLVAILSGNHTLAKG
ncbi:C2 calcium-dependent domain-containing protein 4D-like [Hemiscyllium ocellatum]|uniref:C2 calcium-dependent domain-containing protein 4D-like n=1 Tax=Hemiscyllium ocellatum TaxID=170820 RepID=UPI0029670609|nr:C2 calcium-dependent domain-containing protein 4D-like [Hemiscyllium ocellatum]XP_060679390.1 C2 calcium-dependent domain-containing protein 4D-like [Hemiscyllium ocellatum]